MSEVASEAPWQPCFFNIIGERMNAARYAHCVHTKVTNKQICAFNGSDQKLEKQAWRTLSHARLSEQFNTTVMETAQRFGQALQGEGKGSLLLCARKSSNEPAFSSWRRKALSRRRLEWTSDCSL